MLSGSNESMDEYLVRAGARGVTHISGTPTHWRRALMSPSAHNISPRYIRLSGEIVDQAILNHLRSFYPQARVAHAFASTEAGVAFDVNDGLAGFPAALIGRLDGCVGMKVESGSLRIRSDRASTRYLGPEDTPLRDPDGFVDTGDMVELRGDRYYFVGRRGGIINIGGLKVHPEEIEAVISRHPAVRMSRAKSRRSPITGSIVVADIVLAANGVGREKEIRDEIISDCRDQLAPYKVPAVISFVETLDVTAAGKLARV